MNKFDHLEITASKYDPHIIGITESVPDSELRLINCELFRHDRDSENKGGGVLLYVKSKLKPQETTFTSPFKDQVWCKIADLHIGVCYRSMNYSIVGPDNNDNNLYQLLHEVSKEHFLLMGDFNFPDVNWHDYATNEDASSDCIAFLIVLMIASYLCMFCN